MNKLFLAACALALLIAPNANAQSAISISAIKASDTLGAPFPQTGDTRTLNGIITTQTGELVSGVTVIAINKRLRSWVDVNFAVDNLFNKRYFETQNYFESRIRPGAPIIARIHGTPGYPFGASAGLTFHLFRKEQP